MKKVILFTAVIISLSNFAFAQAANTTPTATRAAAAQMTPEQRAKSMTDKMQDKLNLTTSQHESIYKINLEVANRMDKAKASHDKSAVQSVHKYRAEQFKKILTSQQMATMNEAMAERKNGNAQAK